MPAPAAGVEFGLFLLPISIIHYLPNFFFGSLLMLFGVEILMDWLIYSFKKVSTEQGLVTESGILSCCTSCGTRTAVFTSPRFRLD